MPDLQILKELLPNLAFTTFQEENKDLTLPPIYMPDLQILKELLPNLQILKEFTPKPSNP